MVPVYLALLLLLPRFVSDSVRYGVTEAVGSSSECHSFMTDAHQNTHDDNGLRPPIPKINAGSKGQGAFHVGLYLRLIYLCQLNQHRI